jgi:ParB family transcriptional regulator, chromosome partitioning protein
MSTRDRGMGRGLAAILSLSDARTADTAELRVLAVELIAPNPGQPRKRFDQDSLQALAHSVSDRGVLQPVLVRPRLGGLYELVAGERRWRAARLAGLETMPALVQERDDAGSLEAALVENMAREDLNPIEAARAVAALVEELELSREAVARRIGRSRVSVSNLLRLLDLPDEVLVLLEAGRLTEGHGRALLLADDHGTRRRLARTALERGWSVRVLEEHARRSNAPARPAAQGRREVHPDHVAAANHIADVLSVALGTEVRVRTSGTGFRAELAFDTLEEALAVSRHIAPGAAA